MNNRHAVDRELLIPIVIGGLSVVGIVVVLLIGRALSSPAEIAATASATPFQYVYLGTEPAITTLVVEGSELPPTGEAIEEPGNGVPTSNIPIDTPIIFTLPVDVNGGNSRTNTPGRPATATRTYTPGPANTYDDTDPRLRYGGSWIAQTGLTGPNAPYNGTLHISDVANNNNFVRIEFSGPEIFFYYQSAPSYGIVTIYVDNEPLAFTTINQSQSGGVWHYVFETVRTHIIRIEHTDGGSVNIDRFVIPGPTPTPTP